MHAADEARARVPRLNLAEQGLQDDTSSWSTPLDRQVAVCKKGAAAMRQTSVVVCSAPILLQILCECPWAAQQSRRSTYSLSRCIKPSDACRHAPNKEARTAGRKQAN